MADESAKPMDVLSEEDIVNALANVIHDKLLSALEGGADEEAVKQATEIKPDDAFKVLPDILNLLAPEVPAAKRSTEALKEAFSKDIEDLLEKGRELANVILLQDMVEEGEEEEGEESEEEEDAAAPPAGAQKRAGAKDEPVAKRKREG
eukprot:Hpha_TRINITY_DN14144_c0_g1::TRINITY_DN14144_c0_g1_i2::g.10531::m.10531